MARLSRRLGPLALTLMGLALACAPSNGPHGRADGGAGPDGGTAHARDAGAPHDAAPFEPPATATDASHAPLDAAPDSPSVDGGRDAAPDADAGELPPPVWEPPRPPHRERPVCDGEASPCEVRSPAVCAAGLGCRPEGACRGIARACWSLGRPDCATVEGCHWSEVNGQCLGSSWSCSGYGAHDACEGQSGCAWDERCTGAATACSELDFAQCDGQPGCAVQCAASLALCGADCVDLGDDEDHCGACGASCGPAGSCRAGRCACEEPYTLCDGRCVDTRGDAQNCGACGRVCAAGLLCSHGDCLDIDECALEPCRNGRACANFAGGFVCGPCPAGFDAAGPTACVDVDECRVANGGCDPHAQCENLPGAVACGECIPGFVRAGGTCVDVDECAIGHGGCDPHTTCTNLQGGRRCGACPAGYLGTGETECLDQNECRVDHGGCDPFVVCTNTDGGRTCGPCPSGFLGDGESGCHDIDECATALGGCDPLAGCENLPGGFRCRACPEGYEGDGLSGCTDVDECAFDNGGCDSLTACTNLVGGRTCGACPDGFLGAGDVGCEPALLTLVPSSGGLSPTFDPAVRRYELDVSLVVTSLSLTATAASGVSIYVNGRSVSSGVASRAVPLALGSTTIVVSAAADRHAWQQYSVVVRRGAGLDARQTLSVTEDAVQLAAAHDGLAVAHGTQVDMYRAAAAPLALVASAVLPSDVQRLAFDGARLVVGGAFGVRVYAYDGTSLRLDGELARDGTPTGLAVAADVVAVASNGGVFLFLARGGAWAAETLTARPAVSVATDGNTLVAGMGAGEVASWRRTEAGFEAESSIASSWAAGFGDALAVAGDWLAVGAPTDSEMSSPYHVGHVSVYRRQGSSWYEDGYLAPSASLENQYFGRHVQLAEGLVWSRTFAGDLSGSGVLTRPSLAFDAQGAGQSWLFELESERQMLAIDDDFATGGPGAFAASERLVAIAQRSVAESRTIIHVRAY